jgi:hypothetical protein
MAISFSCRANKPKGRGGAMPVFVEDIFLDDGSWSMDFQSMRLYGCLL